MLQYHSPQLYQPLTKNGQKKEAISALIDQYNSGNGVDDIEDLIALEKVSTIKEKEDLPKGYKLQSLPWGGHEDDFRTIGDILSGEPPERENMYD